MLHIYIYMLVRAYVHVRLCEFSSPCGGGAAVDGGRRSGGAREQMKGKSAAGVVEGWLGGAP